MKERAGTAKGILIVFSVCALADFAWSYIIGLSIVECVISVLFGLFGTACYVLLLRSRKNESETEDPHNPAGRAP